MAGIKFLNPYVKVAICAAGMACMGYFLYPALRSGEGTNGLTVIRGLVFLGFTYLLIRSILEIIEGAARHRKN
jgi:hypothetical protein